MKQLAVPFLQTVKCWLDFWPKRKYLNTTKHVVGPQKRKIKRKIRRSNLFQLYEKNQEKISYRKAKLLLEKAETMQWNAKINKNHCCIINSSKLTTHLRRSTGKKGLHLHNSESKQAPSHKKAKTDNVLKCSIPMSRDLFAECDSYTRWSVFIYDFWWHCIPRITGAGKFCQSISRHIGHSVDSFHFQLSCSTLCHCFPALTMAVTASRPQNTGPTPLNRVFLEAPLYFFPKQVPFSMSFSTNYMQESAIIPEYWTFYLKRSRNLPL